MANSGIARIDQLFSGQTSKPIAVGDPDKQAVGAIQDLLIGQGFSEIPGLLGVSHGVFGNKTNECVSSFQQKNGLGATGAVDRATLQKLVDVSHSRPIISQSYATLALDLVYGQWTRLVSITTQFEGAGRFTAFNANTDKAGLSFGLIQWAQKPLRLNELLLAFQTKEPQTFVDIFSEGSQSLAQGLIAHTAKPRGGTDENGNTTDPKYNLINEPWKGRFLAAGRNRDLQIVQVLTAIDAFKKSRQFLQSYAPDIRSERGTAFMLDLANQHGDGGARSIYTTVKKPGLTEAALLLAMQNESARRVQAQFGNGPEVISTKNRRAAFRTTALLSDAVLP